VYSEDGRKDKRISNGIICTAIEGSPLVIHYVTHAVVATVILILYEHIYLISKDFINDALNLNS
jgi:hypothetical protein